MGVVARMPLVSSRVPAVLGAEETEARQRRSQKGDVMGDAKQTASAMVEDAVSSAKVRDAGASAEGKAEVTPAGGASSGQAREKGAARAEKLLRGRRIICPFCGQPSSSLDHCTRCNALFDKQVRSIAYTEDADPRADSIGPVSTRTGKYLMWAAIAVLLVVFAVATNWAAGYL